VLDELIRGGDSVSLGVTGSAVVSSETTLQNAKANLEKVIAQQDLLVLNAQKTLRSSGLEAYLIDGDRENSSYTFTAPTISGTYNSDEEGAYQVELYQQINRKGRPNSIPYQNLMLSSVKPSTSKLLFTLALSRILKTTFSPP